MITPDDAVDTCIRCGAPLRDYRCKVHCEKCGYQEDCADAGLINHDQTERGEQRRRAREERLKQTQTEQGDR